MVVCPFWTLPVAKDRRWRAWATVEKPFALSCCDVMVVVGVKVSISVCGIKDPVTVTASSFFERVLSEASDSVSCAEAFAPASVNAHASANNLRSNLFPDVIAISPWAVAPLRERWKANKNDHELVDQGSWLKVLIEAEPLRGMRTQRLAHGPSNYRAALY